MLLDEQFMLAAAGSDANLLKNANTLLSTNKAYKRPDRFGVQQFIVAHYAGDVVYDVQGFVEKNKDTVSMGITTCLATSNNSIVGSIF